METLRSDNEVHKQNVQAQLVLLDDRCRLKDNEVKLLEDELVVKTTAAKEQDTEVYLLNAFTNLIYTAYCRHLHPEFLSK